MIALDEFAAAVGSQGPVTIAGLGTRGGAVPGVHTVTAPLGIDFVQADEMIVSCGAGTPVDELVAAMAAHGQTVCLPAGGTVGGALAVGHSDVRRLGYGPVRDTLLQARYVSAAGEIVKAGGPTVKNVSGFDLCRLLVGSYGTLGFLGEVVLRTRPLAKHSQWFVTDATDPYPVFAALYRPVSVLWDGRRGTLLMWRRRPPRPVLRRVGDRRCCPRAVVGRCHRRNSLSLRETSSPKSGSASSTMRSPPRRPPWVSGRRRCRVRYAFVSIRQDG